MYQILALSLLKAKKYTIWTMSGKKYSDLSSMGRYKQGYANDKVESYKIN